MRELRGLRMHRFFIAAFFIIGSSIIIAPTPVAAQSGACPGAPAGFPTSCQASCGSGYAFAGNYVNIDSAFVRASCTSGSCCLQLGTAACNAEATRAGFASGSCKSSCGTGETASRQSVSTCASGQRCCYAQASNAPANTGGCISLPGTTSNCRSSGGAVGDELDLGQTTAYDTWKTACSGVCYVKRGPELCAATAKARGLSGSYACVTNENCGKALSSDFPVSGDTCTAGTLCCIAKNSAATGTAGAKPSSGVTVTLPDPLGGASLPQMIGGAIRVFTGIAGAIALLMFVYGGIMWILSKGEEKRVEDSKKILMNASIGLVLIFGAYFFTSTIVAAILTQSTQ
jgi:hypothetical protein